MTAMKLNNNDIRTVDVTGKNNQHFQMSNDLCVQGGVISIIYLKAVDTIGNDSK